MKVFIAGLFMIACITGFSQDSTANKTDSPAQQEGFDFYVVQAGDLFLSVDTEENTTQMELLDPSWIESITLYKAADARLKYGDKATDGVIIIDLTEDGFKKLPKTLRDKFKKKPT